MGLDSFANAAQRVTREIGDAPRSWYLPLSRVVEDDSGGEPRATAHAAHTMTEIHPVVALRAPHWTAMDCEGHRITLAKGNDFDTALHARPLFGQDEFAAHEIDTGLREEDRDLDRKCEIAIEVLVQAVEVSRDIMQQKRRWARLTGVVASLEERCVIVRIAFVDAHSAIPFISHSCEARIERRS